MAEQVLRKNLLFLSLSSKINARGGQDLYDSDTALVHTRYYNQQINFKGHP